MNKISNILYSIVQDKPGVPKGYRISQVFFTLTVVVDMLMVALGVSGAVMLREMARRHGYVRSPHLDFAYLNLPMIVGYYCCFIFCALKYVDVYRDRRFLTGNREAARIIKAILVVSGVNVFLNYFLPTHLLCSRFTLLSAFVLLVVFIFCGRKFISVFRQFLRGRNLDIKICAIVGSGTLAQVLASELQDTARYGYRLAGFIDEEADKSPIEGIKVFSGTNALERVTEKLGIQEIFICEPDWTAAKIMTLMGRINRLNIPVRAASMLFNSVIERVGMPVDYTGTTPILDFGGYPFGTMRHLVKRMIDISLSFAALLVFLPLWMTIGFCIWYADKGALFYSQKRIGREGKIFDCYKFRTMKEGSEQLLDELREKNEIAGPMFKIKNDPRITTLGHFLRKYSLDEVPQFINILKGDMSLVGPRPPLPSEVQEYDDWHRQRFNGDMGLSGLWQVSGRNELDFEEMALLDIYYLRNQSLFLDYRIIVRTVLTVLLGHGR